MPKKILVTGGKRGIGKAIADLLSANYEVLAPDSKELNVSDISSIENYLKDHQDIDILINNAGIHISKPFLDHSKEDWQDSFNVNFFGAVNITKLVLPHMQKKSWGRIINLSSICGLEACSAATAYSASKFALNGLTMNLAAEFFRNGITVNAICPGWVKTDMALKHLFNAKDHSKGLKEKYNSEAQSKKEAMMLGTAKWIEPEEIAEQVKYLISDKAKSITGQTIKITAGLDL